MNLLTLGAVLADKAKRLSVDEVRGAVMSERATRAGSVVAGESRPEVRELKRCDVCGAGCKGGHVDGATTFGPWAFMCLTCFAEVGIGLGVGRGQRYDEEGRKVAG